MAVDAVKSLLVSEPEVVYLRDASVIIAWINDSALTQDFLKRLSERVATETAEETEDVAEVVQEWRRTAEIRVASQSELEKIIDRNGVDLTDGDWAEAVWRCKQFGDQGLSDRVMALRPVAGAKNQDRLGSLIEIHLSRGDIDGLLALAERLPQLSRDERVTVCDTLLENGKKEVASIWFQKATEGISEQEVLSDTRFAGTALKFRLLDVSPWSDWDWTRFDGSSSELWADPFSLYSEIPPEVTNQYLLKHVRIAAKRDEVRVERGSELLATGELATCREFLDLCETTSGRISIAMSMAEYLQNRDDDTGADRYIEVALIEMMRSSTNVQLSYVWQLDRLARRSNGSARKLHAGIDLLMRGALEVLPEWSHFARRNEFAPIVDNFDCRWEFVSINEWDKIAEECANRGMPRAIMVRGLAMSHGKNVWGTTLRLGMSIRNEYRDRWIEQETDPEILNALLLSKWEMMRRTRFGPPYTSEDDFSK